MSWFLRSPADADTHLGAEADGIVAALCGAVFAPMPRLRNEPAALPGEPPDPAQICPRCRTATPR